MKELLNGRLAIFSKRTDCWHAFSWSICNQMTTLLGVSKAAVSIVMMAYTNHGKSCTLKRVVSKNLGNTAVNLTAELNIHLEDPVSIKTVQQELHQFNIHSRFVIVKPLIAENNVKVEKRWCGDHRTWLSNDWKYIIWSSKIIFHIVPNIRPGLYLENAQGSL
jgi:hypothetical protein